MVFGMEFLRPFRNLPAPWFIDNMLLPLARKISPSMRVGTLEAPSMAAPLITASQIVNVAVRGFLVLHAVNGSTVCGLRCLVAM